MLFNEVSISYSIHIPVYMLQNITLHISPCSTESNGLIATMYLKTENII